MEWASWGPKMVAHMTGLGSPFTVRDLSILSIIETEAYKFDQDMVAEVSSLVEKKYAKAGQESGSIASPFLASATSFNHHETHSKLIP